MDAPENGQTSVKRVLLAGATGYIGRFVARELVGRDYEVVTVVRETAAGKTARDLEELRAQLPGCDVRAASVTDSAQLGAVLDGEPIDGVISCIASRSGAPEDAWRVDFEANRNLLDAARRGGANHFVLLSAICVQRPRLAFQHAKLAFEAVLKESGITYSIVRPTAFFKSLAGQINRIQAGRPFLVFGDGCSTACKPISEADLASFLVDCLEDPALANRILPIGGPGPAITPREQGELLCTLAGRPTRIRRISPKLFDAAIAVLAPLSRIMPSLQAKAEFARIGRYYATESMLLWDESAQDYDAEATPSYGNETLEDFYARVLREGLAGQELGEQKLF
ncbi:MAG: NAD(P)H-binding protein [Thiohalocapsa sp.]